MNAKQLAQFLIEGDDFPQRLKVYTDRLLLRVYSIPALTAYLQGVAVLNGEDKSTQATIQLKFTRLPDETVPQVKKLIGAENIKVSEFSEHSQNYTGFQFVVTEEELALATERKSAAKSGEQGHRPLVLN